MVYSECVKYTESNTYFLFLRFLLSVTVVGSDEWLIWWLISIDQILKSYTSLLIFSSQSRCIAKLKMDARPIYIVVVWVIVFDVASISYSVSAILDIPLSLKLDWITMFQSNAQSLQFVEVVVPTHRRNSSNDITCHPQISPDTFFWSCRVKTEF